MQVALVRQFGLKVPPIGITGLSVQPFYEALRDIFDGIGTPDALGVQMTKVVGPIRISILLD